MAKKISKSQKLDQSMKGLKELTDAVADYENNSGSSDQDGQSNDSEEVIFQKIYYKKSHRKS